MRETFRAYVSLMGIGFRAAPWHATGQLLTGVVFAVAVPIAAWSVKLIVDAAIAGDLERGLLAAGLLALISGGALTCVFYYVDCLFTVMERAGALASQRLMTLMGGTDGLAHHERPEYLDQAHRVREEQGRLSGMVNATAGLLRVGAALGVSAVLLLMVHPLLLLLPVLSMLSFWLGKISRDLKVAAQEATSEPERLRRHLFELGTSAAAGKELRVFDLVDVVRTRHHRSAAAVLRQRNHADWRGAGLQTVDGVVSALGYVGAIGLVLILATSGRATPGDVALVVGVAAQLTGTVGLAVQYGTEFLFVLAVARRFRWLAAEAARARRPLTDPAPVPETLRNAIELRGVSFGYPRAEGGREVLSDISLRLPAGTVVALVGDNGAGKTTLVKLLCGFYSPVRGSILVDGVDVARLPGDQWRARVSAAFQDFASFEFLVSETVGVGDLPRMQETATVRAALERGGATGVVTALPAGLRTQLGARWPDGADLSGGQWQKLALARGLMDTTPLLVVFDEPTAALDAHTEHALFERFAETARAGRASGAVTVLVSHRFSTVRMADLIVVLDGGRIREQGSHQELIAARGLYAELYGLQSRAYR
ncbi:ABC transporter ATP-binding protein [Micromonospora sp. Llam7]|uniref:ABC transporter ATP-binding protein n=1 Tax=Micromonospora tarapacensis TaxID=2835305 RepID=UPI001C837CED|nr:ABC transporter ATP-binding protein [Micromonospora tarapacensis]MBX7266527.1 ABC transporter ATP-binding protein [Micromonospora tarapacensis]